MLEGEELLQAIKKAPQENKDALLYEILEEYGWDIATAKIYPEDVDLQVDAKMIKELLKHYGFANILL